MMKNLARSAPGWAAVVALSLLFGGCDDSITQPLPTGEIVSLKMEIGPFEKAAYALSTSGLVPDTLRLGSDGWSPYYGDPDDPTSLGVIPVPAEGTALPPLSDLQVGLTPTDTTVVSFIRTGAWGGLLYRKRQAITSVLLVLTEKSTGRTVLGPYSIPTMVEP
jgi:hypothetical protein